MPDTTSAHMSPTVTLRDGRAMPRLGIGVWQLEPAQTVECVRHAIDVGYRSIDTAHIYDNEREVGEGLRASGAERDRLFITTKLWNSDHDYDDALRACDASLARLGLDVVDLYLIHWPAPATGNFRAAWRALEHLHADGRVRSIGVSNFGIHHLEQLAAVSSTVPVVNQVELHPRFQQHELRRWCARHDIVVEAWSPLGQGGSLLADPIIVEIAAAHDRTPAQVIIRWHLQCGHVAIPKSATPSRITENFAVFDFTLVADEMERIAALDRVDGRLGPEPASATF